MKARSSTAESATVPGQHAPAVVRAVLVLERLAGADEPISLSALSRALGIGPSSLLAILAPLRAAGVLTRDASGRYALGPTLVGLGDAAARGCTSVRLFERVATWLVERTGETALLWVSCAGELTLAAVREGRHPLRVVPPIGLRLDGAPGTLAARDAGALPDGDLLAGGLLEAEMLPGVWMIASRLSTSDEPTLLAVAGPADRLRGEAGAATRDALRDAVGELGLEAAASESISASGWSRPDPSGRRASGDPMPTERPRPTMLDSTTTLPADRTEEASPAVLDHAGPIGHEELDAFLREGHVATLSYVAHDGYPATVPLWCAWDGAAFWLAPRPGAEWATHVRLDPRVSIAVSESTAPLRRVLARGRIAAVDDPGGLDARRVAAELAARYVGCGAVYPGDAAVDLPLLRFAPERLVAWRGLLRHPRVAPDSGSDARTTGRRQLG